jgi:hypothetical protein
MEKLSVDVIKEEVQLLDHDLEVNEFGFQVAVVLISAGLVTGPNTENRATIQIVVFVVSDS